MVGRKYVGQKRVLFFPMVVGNEKEDDRFVSHIIIINCHVFIIVCYSIICAIKTNILLLVVVYCYSMSFLVLQVVSRGAAYSHSITCTALAACSARWFLDDACHLACYSRTAHRSKRRANFSIVYANLESQCLLVRESRWSKTAPRSSTRSKY